MILKRVEDKETWGLVGYLATVSAWVEASKSRSGLHAARGVVVLVSPTGEARLLDVKPALPGRGTYTRGWGSPVEVNVPDGWFLVNAWLVLNSRGHVSGIFRVYNSSGDEVLRARLRRRKIRMSRGDPRYGWIVEKAVEALGLSKHVRRYNWSIRVNSESDRG